MTTDLVPVRKGGAAQISLSEIQDRLDRRKTVEQVRAEVTNTTKKARAAQAKAAFRESPLETLINIQAEAEALAYVFDASITAQSVPFSQAQIDKLSQEYGHLEKLMLQLAALEERYRELTFAHLDETGPKIPGRPASQVPGKMEPSGDGPRHVFERRGGNRNHPDLDVVGLRKVLSPEQVAQLYVTVNHPAVPAWKEEVFDEGRFGELVDKGDIDLDVVADFLTPGEWRTPSFHKTLVGGEK